MLHRRLRLEALDQDLIGYVQLSDVPSTPSVPNYFEEAMCERLAPGSGDLPLEEILAAVTNAVPLSLEIPQRSLAQAGVGPVDRLRPCVEATRALLASRRRTW